MSFVIRNDGEPTRATDAVRARMTAVAPNIPLFEVVPLKDLVKGSVARERFNVLVRNTGRRLEGTTWRVNRDRKTRVRRRRVRSRSRCPCK